MLEERRVRVGLVGMDHWYLALGVIDLIQKNPRTELVAVAHRNAGQAEEIAGRYHVPIVTTDYAAIAQHPDVDLVVTACTTAQNPELCMLAAHAGKHIISVKPVAMTLKDAVRIVQAVRETGIHFFPYESYYRLDPPYRQYKQWIQEGLFGTPVSAAGIQRATLPRADWPGSTSTTSWWLDPHQVPGGGWIDHAIYFVDVLRWLWESEVVRVGGEIANLQWSDIGLEDTGMATLVFANNAIASLEVTWSAPPGAGYKSFQLVGSARQILSDSITGKLSIGGNVAPFSGWVTTNSARGHPDIIEYMVGQILDGNPPVATVEDAYRNLEICLAFYQAAWQDQSVTLT